MDEARWYYQMVQGDIYLIHEVEFFDNVTTPIHASLS